MQLSRLSRILNYRDTTNYRHRYDSITTFVKKLCILEEAETGILLNPEEDIFENVLLPLLNAGDHLLLFSYSLAPYYGTLKEALEKRSIDHTIVASRNAIDWKGAIRPETTMVIVQSPTFPLLEIIQLREIAKLAKQHELIFVVENSIATPILQTPLSFGADIVLHCYSQWMNGNGQSIGSIVLGKKKWLQNMRQPSLSLSTRETNFSVEMLCDAIITAEVRIERQAATAAWLCRKLCHHLKIEQLRYPGLGSYSGHAIVKNQMQSGGFAFTLELNNGEEAAHLFLGTLQLAKQNNHFSNHSAVSHPYSTLPTALLNMKGLPRVSPSLITVTVGLETREDLLHDLLTALAVC